MREDRPAGGAVYVEWIVRTTDGAFESRIVVPVSEGKPDVQLFEKWLALMLAALKERGA